jgi:hypothetical protein
MQFLNRHFSLLFLWLLLLPAGLWAQESIDCIDYEGDDPDPRCHYQLLQTPVTKGQKLFVVPEGDEPVFANALPNTDFFIYAPKASSDSVVMTLASGGAQVSHMEKVNSGDDRFVGVVVNAKFPIYNVAVGTALNADADFNIGKVYNFYVPGVQYCLDKDCDEPISEETKVQLEVGDELKVYVRAYIPIGPDSAKTDTAVNEKTFYIQSLAAGENLRYYSVSGSELPKRPYGYQIDFYKGRAEFIIRATKAVTDGPVFTINSYKYEVAPGDTSFIVTETFPADLQFINPDMPILDSAFIYDTNGDGKGDSIGAYFTGRLDSVKMETFFHNWPDGGKFKEHTGESEWSNKTGVLELTNVKAGIPADSGEGSLKVEMSSVNTGAKADAQKTLIDRIGPVILTANLIKGGKDAEVDTLELFYNKPIDTSWKEGKGYLLNDSPVYLKTITQDVKRWVFVIDTGVVNYGDSIQIATICKKDCPDGLVKAADGNETGKNNPAVVGNSGRKYADNEKNAFFDRDGDGRMDSASVAFEEPITREILESMEFCYYWLDTNGKLLEIVPDTKDLKLSADGTVVGFALNLKKDEYPIKEKLTAVDDRSYAADGDRYGYVTVTYIEESKGKKDTVKMEIEMHDRMAPVISGTFLQPESYQKMASDVFKIEFSEAIDYKSVSTLEFEDAFQFYVDGEWKSIPFSSVEWAPDGKSAEIRMESGTRLVERMNPADSVRLDTLCVNFVDKEGNGASGNAPAEMVEGDPRVIMQNYAFASREDIDESAQDAITFDVADHLTSEEAKKNLGVLMDVSFSTIMDMDSREMDLTKVGLEWELYVYTNLGTYVASASQKIRCDDSELFDGNCFENPHQMYLRWNMLADNGRRVAVGAYVAHFRVRVYGAKENFKVERFYNWGITGSRKIRSR